MKWCSVSISRTTSTTAGIGSIHRSSSGHHCDEFDGASGDAVPAAGIRISLPPPCGTAYDRGKRYSRVHNQLEWEWGLDLLYLHPDGDAGKLSSGVPPC